MRKIVFALVVGSLGGCTGGDRWESDDPVGESQEALDVTRTSGLTRKQGDDLASITDETQRRADTKAYYDAVRTSFSASGEAGSITLEAPTLTAFKNSWTASASETAVAYYYNRGDLGIGREMHCSEPAGGGWVACYVRNFAGGDDRSDGVHTNATGEFTFGLSSNIAFANMDANHPFATVAMVWMPDHQNNKVWFAVYGADEKLQNFAALDRVGLQNALGTNVSSVNGTNFNNHIPSNCMSCHGGQPYDINTHNVRGALFLPFDLDQFEFQNVPGKTRADQLTAFKRLNEMVRHVNVAVATQDPTVARQSIANQIDTWYHNTSHSETLPTSTFDGSAVPSGWQGASSFYSSVLRVSCRNCHMAVNSHPFDDPTDFNGEFTSVDANGISNANGVLDVCRYNMPHSLQTLRQFWQSSKPNALATYLSGISAGAAATAIKACGPGNVATLDFPLITPSL